MRELGIGVVEAGDAAFECVREIGRSDGLGPESLCEMVSHRDVAFCEGRVRLAGTPRTEGGRLHVGCGGADDQRRTPIERDHPVHLIEVDAETLSRRLRTHFRHSPPRLPPALSR